MEIPMTMLRGRRRLGGLLCLLLCITVHTGFSQGSADEQSVRELVHRFREAMLSEQPGSLLRQMLARDFVYITPTGAMSTTWTFGCGEQFREPQKLEVDQLQTRTFGPLAIASYRLKFAKEPGKSIFRQAFQVFRKTDAGWQVIASQVVSFPGLEGPVMANGISPPVNPPESERALQETWEAYLNAVRRRLPNGEQSEDLVTIRRIQAEDWVFVVPNDGRLMGREERLKIGHPGGVGKLVHEDLNISVFGDAAVFTSRNQEGGNQSINQSIRVFLKRTGLWQLIASKQMWYPQSGPVASK